MRARQSEKKSRMVQKSLRFTEEVAEMIDAISEKERRSFNQVVLMLLEEILKENPDVQSAPA